MNFDLKVSPENPLYAGLGVTEVGGRANLPNAMSADVLNAVGRYVAQQIESENNREEVILTGPAPVQIYLVVFHAVVHRFKIVKYVDGRGGEAIVAQHG